MLLHKTYVVFIVNDKRFLSFTIVYGVLTDVILSQEIGSVPINDVHGRFLLCAYVMLTLSNIPIFPISSLFKYGSVFM